MLRRLLSEVGEMEIPVSYLVKPSPEVIWEADRVMPEQASLEGEVGKLKFHFMCVVIDNNNTHKICLGHFGTHCQVCLAMLRDK